MSQCSLQSRDPPAPGLAADCKLLPHHVAGFGGELSDSSGPLPGGNGAIKSRQYGHRQRKLVVENSHNQMISILTMDIF